MNKLLLFFLMLNLTNSILSCPGCLTNKNCYDRCAKLQYVQDCACECWRYHWAAKRAECINCGHYHMPYDKQALGPDYSNCSQKKCRVLCDVTSSSKTATPRQH